MYNYEEAVYEDVKQYIEDEIEVSEYDRESLEEKLNDDLWVCDSVTGNGSGSYTFNSAKALEYLTEDGFNRVDLLVYDFGVEDHELGRHLSEQDWEWFDVSIRCALLPGAISRALDEIYEED